MDSLAENPYKVMLKIVLSKSFCYPRALEYPTGSNGQNILNYSLARINPMPTWTGFA